MMQATRLDYAPTDWISLALLTMLAKGSGHSRDQKDVLLFAYDFAWDMPGAWSRQWFVGVP